MTNHRSPLVTIVEEIAAREGTEAARLDPPLYGSVDTDALHSLVCESGSADVEVQFEYCGYQVTVRADGAVTVSELETPTA